MTPHPLHRSLTLWSGLVILGFLLWSHRDSTRHDTRALAYLNGVGLSFSSYPGGACLAYQTGTWIKPSITLDRTFIPPGSEPTAAYPENPMRPAYQVISLSDGSGGSSALLSHVLVLPYWVLIALWLCLWAAMFIYRARRERRIKAKLAKIDTEA